MSRDVITSANDRRSDGYRLIPRTLDDFVKFLAKSSRLLGRQPFTLTCARIVLIVVLETHESEIIQINIVVPTIQMSDLARLDFEVPIQAIAQATSASAQHEDALFDLGRNSLSGQSYVARSISECSLDTFSRIFVGSPFATRLKRNSQ